MSLFNKKKKLITYYFTERIFDRETYRLAHREQREVDGLGGEATKEKVIRSGYCIILSKQACFG